MDGSHSLLFRSDSSLALRGPSTPSLDHLVSRHLQRERHLQAERLRGLEIDDQLEFGRLQDRKVGGLLALENPPGVNASMAVGVRKTRSVAHQAADGSVLASRIHSRDGMACRQCNELLASIQKENIGLDQQG